MYDQHPNSMQHALTQNHAIHPFLIQVRGISICAWDSASNNCSMDISHSALRTIQDKEDMGFVQYNIPVPKMAMRQVPHVVRFPFEEVDSQWSLLYRGL